jgi:hypothetical protein
MRGHVVTNFRADVRAHGNRDANYFADTHAHRAYLRRRGARLRSDHDILLNGQYVQQQRW